MREITGGGSKELLRLGGVPVVERVIVEALALQPEKVVVVTSPEKQDLNNFLADQRVTCVFQEPRRGS
jgi:bifunctional N-acetylglucosamine-1-phosphate-uridyltransferase/glucosamine-1-phosphate-acetyltransferase GlmU-like protein